MKLNRRMIMDLVTTSIHKWSEHNGPRLGAALAFYTLLSLAPLVILVVAICGFVFTRSSAEHLLISQAQELAGPSGAATVQALIQHSSETHGGFLAGTIAIITLLFGASGVFVELRDSLNTIWDAPPVKYNIKSLVWRRTASFGMVLALGFVLMVSLMMSAALGVLEKIFTRIIPINAAVVGEAMNLIVSLLAVAALCALIFKFVPDLSIEWRDVEIGAIVTAVLFTIGRAVLSFYLSTAGLGSPYGAAGSIVALVVWVYYSGQIFFFGAQLTRVYADKYGSRPHGAAIPRAHEASSGLAIH